MARNFCTTPWLRPGARVSLLSTVASSKCGQAQGQAAKASLTSGASRNQMLARHLTRICERLTVRNVSGAATALSSPDSKASAPFPPYRQANQRKPQTLIAASGNGHLTKPSELWGKDGSGLPSRHEETPSESKHREGPAATRPAEESEVKDGDKLGSVADVLAQMREQLKKANGKHRNVPQTSLDGSGRGVNGAASQENKVLESTRPASTQSEDQEVLMSLQKSKRLPPMELPGRIKMQRGSEVKEASVHPNIPTRSLHIKAPKEAQTEGQIDVTSNDKQHSTSSDSKKQLPPLRLRPRSQLRKSTDSRNGQAASSPLSFSNGRLATNGASFNIPQMYENFAGLRGGTPQGEPSLSFLKGEEQTSFAPLTEWRQKLEASTEPLEVPSFFQGSSALESAVQSIEELSLRENGTKDAPLTEWLERSSNAPEARLRAGSARPDNLETDATSRKQEADASLRTEYLKPLTEYGLSEEGKEVEPLTEWITGQESNEVVTSQDRTLESDTAAPLTEWRSQASVETANGRAATQNGAKPQPSLVSARPVSPNGLLAMRKGLSHPQEMLLAEAGALVKESNSDDEQQRTTEWHALRKWRLTASAFGNAVGCWPDGRLRLWEEKLELREPFRGNDATAWGTAREPSAIEQYLHVTGNKVSHQAFQIYKEHDEVYTWLGASPDGLIERDAAGLAQGSGVLEVKCPFGRGRPQAAQPYDSVPYYYIPQVQGLLEIFDRQWADVFVWTVNGSVVFRVERAREYWALLFPVLSEFWWQHVIPAKHEMLQGRTDPAYLRNFQPGEEHPNTKLIVAESRQLSANSPAIWRDSGRV